VIEKNNGNFAKNQVSFKKKKEKEKKKEQVRQVGEGQQVAKRIEERTMALGKIRSSGRSPTRLQSSDCVEWIMTWTMTMMKTTTTGERGQKRLVARARTAIVCQLRRG
jgi:hypothetical protein